MKTSILLFIAFVFALQFNTQSLQSIESINEPETFILYGNSTLSSTEDIVNSLSASQKITAEIIFKKLDPNSTGLKGLSGLFSINAINLEPNSVSKDSIDLVSLMFPETGNTGFLLAPRFYWKTKDINANHNWIINSEISISLRQSKIKDLANADSMGVSTNSEINFSVLNFNFMPFNFTYSIKN